MIYTQISHVNYLFKIKQNEKTYILILMNEWKMKLLLYSLNNVTPDVSTCDILIVLLHHI